MSDPVYVSRGGQKLRHALTEFGIDVSGLVCADLGCSTGGFTDCLLQSGAAKVYAVDTAYGELAWKLRKDPRVVVMERSNALHTEPAEKVDVVVVDLGWTTQRQLIPVAVKWLKERTGSVVPPVCRVGKTGADGDGRPEDGGKRGNQGNQGNQESQENQENQEHRLLRAATGGTGTATGGTGTATGGMGMRGTPPCIITLIKPHYEAKYTRFAGEAAGCRGVLPDELAEQVMQEVVKEMRTMGVVVGGVVKSPLRGGTKGDGNVEWVAVVTEGASTHN